MNKLFFLLLLILSFHCNASDGPKWPSGQFTIDSLNKGIGRQLNSYFNFLKTSRAFRYNENGFKIYYKNYNKVSLHASFKITGKYTYLIYKNRTGVVRVRVTNSDIDTAHELLEFNFSGILKRDNFEINFINVGIRLTKQREGDRTLMRYINDWATIYINQVVDKNISKSDSWFVCQKCDGEKLTMIFDKTRTYGKKTYLVGKLAVEVTPNEYFKVANKWYLRSINKQPSKILDALIDKYKWPKTQ